VPPFVGIDGTIPHESSANRKLSESALGRISVTVAKSPYRSSLAASYVFSFESVLPTAPARVADP
jgi:hypothetical protein